MIKSTISTFELFQMFPDAEAARVYMEGNSVPPEMARRLALVNYRDPLTVAAE